MSNVHEWSTSAASNNSASPNGFPEGMAPSGVNDAAREVMAAVARWYQDAQGSLTTGGTSNAYTLTSNSTYAALNDQAIIVFRADRANTGSATLNVDSLGAKTIQADGANLAAGDLVADSLYMVAYNSTNDTYDLLNAQAGLEIGADVQAWDAGLDDIADLAVTDGNFIVGDGANWVAESGADARASLGLTIGTHVQAQDAMLQDIADLTDPNDDRILFWDNTTNELTWLDIGTGISVSGTTVSVDAALGDLSGVGVVSAADRFLVSSGAGAWSYETAAQVRTTLDLEVGTDVQAYSDPLADLDGAGVVSGADRFLVSSGAGSWSYETAAQVRATLSLEPGTDVQTQNAHLTDLAALSAVSGADRFMVSSGAGAWAYETAAQVRATLDLEVGTDVQAFDAHLDDLAALSTASGADQVMVSTGAGTWALESGATLRSSLGLGTSNSPQFAGINVGNASDTTITRDAAGQIAVEGDAVFSHDNGTYTSAKVFFSTSAPTTEGSNGDIYFEYT